MLIMTILVATSSLFVGGAVPYAVADGDGDGGDSDGDGDDGGDDGGEDGGSDHAAESGDGSDGGDDLFEDDHFLDWLADGEGIVTTFQPNEISEVLSQSREQALITSQWNNPISTTRMIAVSSPPSPGWTQVPLNKKATVEFPHDRLQLHYRQHVVNTDHDIAIIIGNANYQKFGSEVPNVTPAYADAEAFAHYARNGLGIREGNVMHLTDATQAQMIRLFGSEQHPKGELYDWVKRDKSRVYLYFSGHGAPGVDQQSGNYLVPADADANRLALNGYPIDQLYHNLSKLEARSVTVVLEACFSGLSQESQIITHASPIFIQRTPSKVPEVITVISAGVGDQIASWEQDRSNGLFTKYYLYAMSGEADQPPYGNGDGAIDMDELERYLQETLTYWARRYYGREQIAQIWQGGAS